MLTPDEINQWKLQHPWWNIYQGHWEGHPCQWRIDGLSHSNDFQFLKTDLENIEKSVREDERKKIRKVLIEHLRPVFPHMLEQLVDEILSKAK